MKRTLTVMAAAAMACVGVAGPAQAVQARGHIDRTTGSYTDWGPWQSIPYPNFSVKDCGTNIKVVVTVNRERIRTRNDSANNQYQQIKGVVHQRLYAADGRVSRDFDLSGSTPAGGSVAYADGSYLFDYLGDNSLIGAPKIAGLPDNFVSYGPLTVLFGSDGTTTTLLRAPQKVLSICSLLDGKAHPPFTVPS